jgi:hypothetical protein
MSHIWPEPDVDKYEEYGCATPPAYYLILLAIVAIVSFVCGYSMVFFIGR